MTWSMSTLPNQEFGEPSDDSKCSSELGEPDQRNDGISQRALTALHGAHCGGGAG